MTDNNELATIEYADMRWKFEMVAEVVEKSWIGWVLKRMRMAMDDKVRIWVFFHTACSPLLIISTIAAKTMDRVTGRNGLSIPNRALCIFNVIRLLIWRYA